MSNAGPVDEFDPKLVGSRRFLKKLPLVEADERVEPG